MNEMVATEGWLETSNVHYIDLAKEMIKVGVKTFIFTDISKDGAMRGTNRALYRELSSKYSVNIVASGGVSSLDDISALKEMGLYGAIIGKAYYTGEIDLAAACEVAK